MEEEKAVRVYPPAVCPKCGSGGAVLIPASQVGWLFDWVLCYGCGEVSVVNAVHG